MNLSRKILRRMIAGYKVIQKREQAIATQTPFEVQQVAAKIPITVQVQPVQAIEGAQPVPEIKIEGYEIPPLKLAKVRAKEKEEFAPRTMLAYPLIPRKPAKGEPILALAKIFWNEKLGRYVYQLDEPKLAENILQLTQRVKEFLEDRLDVDFSKLRLSEAAEFLNKHVDEILRYYKVILTPEELTALKYYIMRDFVGLGKIEPLMRDADIEDISCDGIGIPIFIFHRNSEIGSVSTNILFENADELDSFIIRLAQLAGKSVSILEPLVSGTLPDGSRLQGTLATDIARKGSNFTIRKFTEEPLTPIHLLNYGTIDVRALAYLWLAVDYGRSMLVAGGTASGKTSFLNVLSLFIRPDKKIISIEDTAELRLPHPHWVPAVARTAIATTGKTGEIDMFQLLKESFRQRPDYIIVGEVRGQEAYVLFQQMATGHPSLATIHAENIDKLVDRLTTAPISLPKPLIGSLDLVVFMAKLRYREKFIRRVVQVDEMIEFDPKADKPIVNPTFKWNPVHDRFDVSAQSIMLKKISEATGTPKQEVFEEFQRRMLVLNWLQEKGVTNYRDVYRILNMYYYYPNRVLDVITGEM